MTYPQQGFQQPMQQQGFQQPPPQQPMQQGFQQPPVQYQQQMPQGYQQPQQQPAPELAAGSLDAFWSQPSVGGGAALKFPQDGASHVGIVARPITDADIQQQTQKGTNAPAFYKDGRPKFVMKVPMQVQPSQDHPDGQAQWWVQGAARDELVRAMAEAGAPVGPPEAGAAIRVTRTGQRAIPGMNPANVYRVEYQRPQGAAPVPQQQAAPAQPEAQPQQPAQPEAPAQPEPPQQQAAPPAEQAQPEAPAPAVGNGEFSAEQNALLAQLTGKS